MQHPAAQASDATMHLPDINDSYLNELAGQLHELTGVLLSELPPEGPPLRFESTADLLATQVSGRLFRITAGELRATRDGKWLYSAGVGDLVGLAASMQLADCRLQSDYPLELLPYQRDALLRHVNGCEALQKRWSHYLLLHIELFQRCLALKSAPLINPPRGFLDFQAGELIIRQGDEADCVYTLLEGGADALRDGIKVGEIHAAEIFGAMAVFTGQARSASVVAKTECSVLAVRKEDFLSLVVHQPQLCLGLIEEMADKINQLNRHVLELQQA